MRSEQALREAAGLEQGEAQQDCVAHAGPYRAWDISVRGDTLYQNRVDSHAHHD